MNYFLLRWLALCLCSTLWTKDFESWRRVNQIEEHSQQVINMQREVRNILFQFCFFSFLFLWMNLWNMKFQSNEFYHTDSFFFLKVPFFDKIWARLIPSLLTLVNWNPIPFQAAFGPRSDRCIVIVPFYCDSE